MESLNISRQSGRKRIMSASIVGSGRLAGESVRTGFSQTLTLVKRYEEDDYSYGVGIGRQRRGFEGYLG